MGYETQLVQKSLELQLKRLGWEYYREYRMPLYGRADFIAFHPNVKQPLIIECKRDCQEINQAILQVLGYRLQYPADVAIVVPTHTKTVIAEELCKRWGVRLGVIELIDRDTYMAQRTVDNLLSTGAEVTIPTNGRH